MNLRTLVLASSLALTPFVAACGKASDLPHMQEEATGIANNFKPRFDHLAKRGEALGGRARALRPSPADANVASQTFNTAMTKLQNARMRVEQAKTSISAAATKGRVDLQRELDGLRTELTHAFVAINADLNAVESWIVRAERTAAASTARATPPVVPPPAPEGATAPAPGAGTGSAG